MESHSVTGMPESGVDGISTALSSRSRLLHRAWALAAGTFVWNALEGVISVVAGVTAGSVALIAFGIDSFVETASAAVAAWRVREEQKGKSSEDTEDLERKASRIAGTLLLMLSVYITIDASRRLLGFGSQAEESFLGLALTAISLIVMPAVGWAKLRTARALKSRALRADAYETIACAWLSFTTLLGLALNAFLGWWWADPLAALVLVPLIVREGIEGWKDGD
ncbi:MAG: cation diffusion facilitator family transporter [Acidobacteriota bacterium]